MKKILFVSLLLFFCSGFLFAQNSVKDSVFISDIKVSGNKKTKKNVILRELTFNKGSYISEKDFSVKTIQSKINLLKTPLFNSVEINYSYVDSFNVVFDVIVEERWYLWPQAAVYYADRNFSNWIKNKDFSRTDLGIGVEKYNFRGRNEKLSFYAIVGYDEELLLKYENFYFDKGRNHSGAIFLKQLKRKETGCKIENDKLQQIKLSENYALKAYTASFKYQYRKYHFTTHSAYLGFEHRSLSDSLLNCNSQYTVNSDLPVNYFFLKYLYSRDKRDSRVFPLRGYQIELTAIKNGLNIFSETGINSLKFITEFSKYTQFGNKFFLENNFTFQKTFEENNPFFLNTALGYSSNIRSYEYYVINGSDFVLLKNTINFEILPETYFNLKFIPSKKFNNPFLRIFIDVFSDFAYVKNNDLLYNQNNSLANTPLFSVGTGINVLTYYDWLIRFEYSINKQKGGGFFLHFEAPF